MTNSVTTLPAALAVQPGDRVLGIPNARGAYYQAWQVDALRRFWPDDEIHPRRDASHLEAALARAAEIVDAFDASGLAQAQALGQSLH